MSSLRKNSDKHKEKSITEETLSPTEDFPSATNSSDDNKPSVSSTISPISESSNNKTDKSKDSLKASSDSSLPLDVTLSQHKQVAKEKDEFYQRLLRLQAEFDNYRKRTEKEKQSFYDYSLGNFFSELLPILDAFERGMLAPDGETIENFKTGFQLIFKQFKDVITNNGLLPIDAIGKTFDPNFHEAVIREETNAMPDNEIVSEMQRGYLFKDRVLRPSLVTVAANTNENTNHKVSYLTENSIKEPISDTKYKKDNKSNDKQATHKLKKQTKDQQE